MRRKAERFAPYAAVLGASLLAEASAEVEADAASFSEEEAAVDSLADVLWFSLDALDEEELLLADVLPEEAAGFDSDAETLLTEMVSVLLLTVVPL